MKEKRVPVYTMGSADPRTFIITEKKHNIFERLFNWIKFSLLLMRFRWRHRKERKQNESLPRSALAPKSISPISPFDIKFRFKFKDGTSQVIAEIQALSYDVYKPNKDEPAKIIGDFHAIIFDRHCLEDIDQDAITEISLDYCNEYGSQAIMSFEGIELIGEYGGCSIDDIIMESHHRFSAEKIHPWHPVETKVNNKEEIV